MLDASPSLRAQYTPSDGNTEVYYLKNATAVISSFMGIALCHFALTAKENGLELSFARNDPMLKAESDMEYIASYCLGAYNCISNNQAR